MIIVIIQIFCDSACASQFYSAESRFFSFYVYQACDSSGNSGASGNSKLVRVILEIDANPMRYFHGSMGRVYMSVSRRSEAKC